MDTNTKTFEAILKDDAKGMEALRVRMGDEAFYKFIKDYAGQMSHRRATTEDFFRLVRKHTSQDISDLIMAYFANGY